MATLTQSDIGGHPPITPDLPTGGGGGDDGSRSNRGDSRMVSIIGILVLMCASVMTFAALTSAMVVRRGLNGMDWHRMPMPRILYWNTAVLILSSIAIDAARRALRRGNNRRLFNRLWTLGTVLGTLFLAGQIVAWKQIQAQGYFMQEHLSTAFFYVMTWAHAAHVVGALFGVGYVEYRALTYQLGTKGRTWVDVSSIFWHFLDGMWLCIMALFVWWA